MSTDSPAARPHVSREYRDWDGRVGDELAILVGGRVIEAPLQRVSLDCEGLAPSVRLHVGTANGTIAVAPGQVLG